MGRVQKLVKLYQDDWKAKKLQFKETGEILQHTHQKVKTVAKLYYSKNNSDDILDLLKVYNDETSFLKRHFNRLISTQTPRISAFLNLRSLNTRNGSKSTKDFMYDPTIDDDNISADSEKASASNDNKKADPQYPVLSQGDFNETLRYKNVERDSQIRAKSTDKLEDVMNKLLGFLTTESYLDENTDSSTAVNTIDQVMLDSEEIKKESSKYKDLNYVQLVGENPYHLKTKLPISTDMVETKGFRYEYI